MATVTIYAALLPPEKGASHALLYRAAAHFSRLTAAQLGPLVFGEQGKPAFSLREEICFSISHSGDYWVCGFSELPLGLDLQQHQTRLPPERLSRRFFHPLENAYLASREYAPFFDAWSAKESWVKYTGRGFRDAPDSFSVVEEGGAFPAKAGAVFRLLPFQEGYSFCLCTGENCEVRFASFE